MNNLSQFLGKLIWAVFFFLGSKLSGLKNQSITIDNHQYHYLVSKNFSPELDTLLLLHGFTGFKEYWFNFIFPLKRKFNIISIDLPGHGSSSFNHEKDFKTQTIELIDTIKTRHELSKLHIIAASIGAWVACQYADYCPDQLKSPVLIGPAGIPVKEASEFYQAVDRQQNPFWVKTQQDYNTLLGFAIYNPPPDFCPLSSFLLSDYLKHQPVYQIIWNQIVDQPKWLANLVVQQLYQPEKQ